ncbi:MAG: hypothetical protein Q7I99_07130 [Acholeplasmataceae bacterium]|nr:hypothetical protein [Acholeplasmataceae bacterium]
MKKTRVLFVVLIALFVGFLTACTSTADLLDEAKEALVANYSETISNESYQVTGNLTLVTEISGATVSWASSNTALITAAGVVTRPEANTNVTLTATLTIKGETATQTFRVTVKAVDVTVAQRLAAAKALLVTNYAATIGNDEYEVMANLTLVTSIGDGATVAWSSSDPAIVATNGTVVRPSFSTGDQTVTLTATLSIGTQTTTQVFYAFVPALAKTMSETLQEALALAITFPVVEGVTGVETWLVFPGTQVLGDTTYNVVWTSDKPQFLSTTGTVTRPASGQANEVVTMTASITVGAVTETAEVQFTVFAIEAAKTLASIAAVYQEAVGAYVRFEGVTVIGKMTTGFFISDGTTMLYVYDSATLYNTVQIGSVYDIQGLYDIYFSGPQLINNAARPLTAVASSAAPASMNGTESTVLEAVGTKPAPSAANLMVYDYLSITGKIMIDARETVDIGRYNTFLVDSTFTGTEVIKTLASGKATEYNTPAIIIYYQSPNKAAVEALNGQNVTINILLYGWRTDRNVWYAVYLGDGTDIQVSFASDTEAVAAVKTGLTQPATITNATTLTLRTAQHGATISWASNNESVINSSTGVVTPVAGEQVTVTLTATITKGDVTDTKVFTIKVGELPVITVLEAINAATNTELKTKGVVTAAEYYRTFFIQDATGGIAIYTADATMLATLTANVGKEVLVTGSRSVFSGLRQIAPTSIVATNAVVTLPAAVNVDAVALNNDMLPYQGQIVTMTQLYVSSLPAESFGNVTVRLERLSEGTTFDMKWDSRKVLSTASAALLAGLKVGDVIDVTNVLAWNNNPFFYFTDSTIVTNAAMNDASKLALAAKELSLPAKITEAVTITLPTVGLHGTTIAWISSNTTTFTNDGVVTIPSAPETVTVTATVTLGTATKVVVFEILIGIEEPVVPVTTATASYTGTTSTNMTASPANNAALVNLDPTMFTVTSTLGLASVQVGLNSAGQIRLYGNRQSGDGNTLMIAIADGYKITKVSITYGASSNNPTATLTLGTAETLLVAADLLNKTTAYEALSIQSFSMKNTQLDAVATSNAQIYILSIVIDYAADAPATTTVTASYTGATTNMTASPANNAALVGLDPAMFTVTSTLGLASVQVGLNVAGQIRIYANRASGDGNTLMIAIAAGYKITGVTITYGASTTSPTATLTLGTVETLLLAADLLNKTTAYEALSIQSFSIKNTQNNPSASANAQIYILSIVIDYEANA